MIRKYPHTKMLLKELEMDYYFFGHRIVYAEGKGENKANVENMAET